MCLFVIFYVFFVYVFVENVALLGNEAGLADQELKHRLIGAVVGAGS